MTHQTNMRGAQQSRIPRTIFGNTSFARTRQEAGVFTNGCETSCHPHSNRSVLLPPNPPRLTVTRGDKAQSLFHQLAARVSRRQGGGYWSSSHGSSPTFSVAVCSFENLPSRKADVNECHFLSLSGLSQEQIGMEGNEACCRNQTITMSEGPNR